MIVPFSYNLRNLFVRRATTAATALGIGLVVFVFAATLMLGESVQRTLGRAGDEDVAVVLRDGSDAELSSSIDEPSVGIITAAEGVRHRQDGSPDATSELLVVAAMEKLGANGVSNVTIRGVRDDVLSFRPSVKLAAGRMPRPGSEEAVVGRAIRGRFAGVELGQRFEIKRNRTVEVVGVLEDGGSSHESELWIPLDTVRTAFGRGAIVSAVRVRLESAARFDAFKRAVSSNRQLQVDVVRETDYYAKLSEGTSIFVRMLGIVIAFFFSLGAMIGAMITMYAAVANRMREIGTLRALGFSRFAILVSFLTESIVLAMLGGVFGVLAAVAMGAVEFSMMNFQSWSEMTFTFEPTPQILVASVVVAMGMGLFGGLFPAIRASRVNVLEALRS